MASEYFYGGASYPLDANSDPAGYGSPVMYGTTFGNLGTSVDARTANQVKEISKHLNTGLKVIEVAGHSPEVFESIPKEHFKELNRLAKLTGAELTLHAPMIDPTGITQHGWNPTEQKFAENQLWDAIKKSHDLNPTGNVNVNFHASTTQLPTAELKIREGEEIKTKSIILITPDGSNLRQIKEEVSYLPEEGKFTGKSLVFDPEKAIIQENKKFWNSQLDNLNYQSGFGMSTLKRAVETQKAVQAAEAEGKKIPEELKEEMEQEFTHGKLYARNAYTNLKQTFDLVYKEAKGNDKEKLNNFANKISEKNIGRLSTSNNPEDIKQFAKLVEEGVRTLGSLEKPRLLVPLRQFAVDKSAETTANLALKSYNQFHETAPIITLENHPANESLLTTGEDLKEVIKAAREKFIKKAVAEGIDKETAEDQSKKLIGATWDVGHINMMRKYGFTGKDIISETKKVAPYVKHVHLSDNFGFQHTELPMGMGNVPIKEIMGELGKEGFKGKQVAEALSWWQHFSEQGKFHAIGPTASGMGAQIYAGKSSPTWNQYMGAEGGYFTGFGVMNPEVHHSLYGAGFTNLPMELGGNISGKDSRFSGTPMD